MSDHKVQHEDGGTEDEKGGCQPLCWIPIVMLFLCYALGICCLFFFSTGGLVLCILHFVLGTILVLSPYAVHRRSDKVMAIAAIVGMSLYICLLVATFVYAAWLLGQNAHSEVDLYASDKRPLLFPLLVAYAQHALLSPTRRLDAVDGPVGLDGLQGIENYEEERKMSPTMSVPEEGNMSPTTQMPEEGNVSPTTHMPKEGESHTSDSVFFPSAKHGERLSADGPAEDPLNILLPKEKGGTNSYLKDGQDQLIRVAQRKVEEIVADESLNPTVLRQGVKQLADFKLTKSDVKCIEKLSDPSADVADTENRFATLLDYGLFCGYTHYSVATLRKWPLSCEKDCHFDKFHFSNVRKDEKKGVKQAYELLEDINAMSMDQAQFCTVLARITYCKIGQDHLQHAAMAIMCMAVILCICLFGFGVKCITVCASIIDKENKRNA